MNAFGSLGVSKRMELIHGIRDDDAKAFVEMGVTVACLALLFCVALPFPLGYKTLELASAAECLGALDQRGLALSYAAWLRGSEVLAFFHGFVWLLVGFTWSCFARSIPARYVGAVLAAIGMAGFFVCLPWTVLGGIAFYDAAAHGCPAPSDGLYVVSVLHLIGQGFVGFIVALLVILMLLGAGVPLLVSACGVCADVGPTAADHRAAAPSAPTAPLDSTAETTARDSADKTPRAGVSDASSVAVAAGRQSPPAVKQLRASPFSSPTPFSSSAFVEPSRILPRALPRSASGAVYVPPATATVVTCDKPLTEV
jgi:hypothetical protein